MGKVEAKQVVDGLRRPLPPESIGFKLLKNPQPRGNGFSKGQVAGFHDARSVVERLNLIVPGMWEDEYCTPPVGNGLMCRLKVDGVTRCDVGFSTSTTTDMGVKALYSDAFKRAGVKFGIGAFLYAMPRMYVDASELKNFARAGENPKWFMPDAVVASLRGKYGKWLKDEGIKHFGEPTVQGDSLNPQGDVESDDDISVPDEEERAHDEAGRQKSEEKSKPRGLLEYTRTAIRSKDRKLLSDEVWNKLIAEHTSASQKRELLETLNATYAQQGGDPVALREAFDRQAQS